MTKYYLAAPGFTKAQLSQIKEVENILKYTDLWSPFSMGGKLSLKGDSLDPLRVKKIFDENIDKLKECTNLIALVDEFDKGTYFEIGYFAGLNVLDCRNITLIGKHSKEINKWINEIYELFIENEGNIDKTPRITRLYDNGQDSITIVDLTTKTESLYLELGFFYALSSPSAKFVGFSNKKLESNVMTGCALNALYIDYTMDYQGFVNSITDNVPDVMEKLNEQGFSLDAVILSNSIE